MIYLWKLMRPESVVTYDQMHACVVAATTPRRARMYAASLALDEGEDAWINTGRSTAKRIGIADDHMDEGVVLSYELNG